MKKMLIAAAALFLAHTTQAQDFYPVLKNTFEAFDTTQNLAQKVEYGNKLGLIAKKYSKDWLTAYYAAYAKVQLSYMEQNSTKKDAILDEAESLINESVANLGKDNDETYVVKAMIANSRLSVDPRNRYQKYGKIFSENLEAAKAINPDNPRIYLVSGISKFFTPEMFGGGKKAALPLLEKANGLYEKRQDEDITKPYWGKRTDGYFISQATK